MPYVARHHTTYDEFWKERAAAEQLDKIKVPVYSIGLWTKVDLHLNGNIVGYQRIGAPKKLLLLGTSNLYAAVSDFSSVAFHEKFLLPFYDHYLKGRQTPYLKEPNVRYFVGGADEFKTADTWPPAHVGYQAFYLKRGPSGSITSLNDGALDAAGPDRDSAPTRFDYPNPGWRAGVVGFDAGSVTTGTDVYYRAAHRGYRDRGADQARSLRRFHQLRYRLRGQALRPGASVAGSSDERHSTGISGGDQGLVAGVPPCCGPEAVDRIRALVHARRSSAP
jgi:putative CocE/NonD family hydrolase